MNPESRPNPGDGKTSQFNANAVKPLTPIELESAIHDAFAQPGAVDGWVNLAAIGTTLKRRIVGFEPWHYGYEKLSYLLRSCGLVEIRQDDTRYPPSHYAKLRAGARIANIRPPLTLPEHITDRKIATNTRSPIVVQGAMPVAVNTVLAVPQSTDIATPPEKTQQIATDAFFSKPPRNPGHFLYCWAGIFGKDIEALGAMALRETWEFGGFHNPQRPFPILESYLRYTFYRLWVEKKVLVRGQFSAFNTGLVDRRYEPIFAIFSKTDRTSRPWRLLGFCIAGEDNLGKQLVWHFNPLPEPPHYFQNINYMFYNISAPPPSVDWEHVIIENLERLPSAFLEDNCPKNFEMKDTKQMSPDLSRQFYYALARAVKDDLRTYRMVKSRLDAAVELALKRVRWNYKTAIPVYFPTNNRMNMLLPLALVSDEVIDIALVVERTDSGNYLGHTILPLDWAYNNARLVCRPNSEWLSPALIDKSSEISDGEPLQAE